MRPSSDDCMVKLESLHVHAMSIFFIYIYVYLSTYLSNNPPHHHHHQYCGTGSGRRKWPVCPENLPAVENPQACTLHAGLEAAAGGHAPDNGQCGHLLRPARPLHVHLQVRPHTPRPILL